jgi:hypothetical protein
MTVSDKLRAVMARDDNGEGPIGLAVTKLGAGPHPDRDTDIGAWGVTFGIAWAIARAEDPFESDEHVGVRAMKAAWPVFLDANGSIAPGPRYE